MHDLLLYPNPFVDMLNIRVMGLQGKHDLGLRVFTVTGEKVVVNYTVIGNTIGLQRGNLSQGFYLLEVWSGGQKISNGKFTVK
jgi:hypothetical protein